VRVPTPIAVAEPRSDELAADLPVAQVRALHDVVAAA